MRRLGNQYASTVVLASVSILFLAISTVFSAEVFEPPACPPPNCQPTASIGGLFDVLSTDAIASPFNGSVIIGGAEGANEAKVGIGTGGDPSSTLHVMKAGFSDTGSTHNLAQFGYEAGKLSGNRQVLIQQWGNKSTTKQFLLGNGYINNKAPSLVNGPYTRAIGLMWDDDSMDVVINSEKAFGKAGVPVSGVTINSETGNVGIGTTSPGGWFEAPVLEVSGARGTLTARTTTVDGLSTLRFVGPSAGSDFHVNFSDKTGDLSFHPYKGGYKTAVIFAGNGNVGIGTTDPKTKLEVNGLLNVGAGAPDYNILSILASSKGFPKGDGTQNNWSTNGAFWATPMIYRSMRSPNDGSGAFPWNQYGELILQGTSHGSEYHKGISFVTWNGSNADPSIRMRINENGNVGIGRTDPQRNLHVYGTNGNLMKIENNGTGNAVLEIQSDNNAQTAINFLNSGGSAQGQLAYQQGTGVMTLNTAGAERMRIDSSGNVSVNGTVSAKSAQDAVLNLQTTDDKWLYTQWLTSNGTRRIWMGLDSGLNWFNIQPENGTRGVILGGEVGIGGSLNVNANVTAKDFCIGDKCVSDGAFDMGSAGTGKNLLPQSNTLGNNANGCSLANISWGACNYSGGAISWSAGQQVSPRGIMEDVGDMYNAGPSGDYRIHLTKDATGINDTRNKTFTYSLWVKPEADTSLVLVARRYADRSQFLSTNCSLKAKVWTRCSATGTTDNANYDDNSEIRVYLNPLQGVRYAVFGAQFEQSSIATAYEQNAAIMRGLNVVSGNVGIGTTDPKAKLHVLNGEVYINNISKGDSTINNNTYALQIGPLSDRTYDKNTYYAGIAFNHLLNFSDNRYNGAPQGWIGLRLYDTPGSERSSLVFATKPGTSISGSGNDIPQERMTIDPFGNVGIGTTDPKAQLSVTPSGASWNEGIEINPAPNNYNGIYFRKVAGTVDGTWFTGRLANNDVIPDAFAIAKQGLGSMSGTGRSDTPFAITTSGVSLFGGNVGIGTRSPQKKLDVYGAGADTFVHINSNDNFKSGIQFAEQGYSAYDNSFRWGVTEYYDGVDDVFHIDPVRNTVQGAGLRMNGDGNVGIGGNPGGYPLLVNKNGEAYTSFSKTKYIQLMANGNNQTGGGIAVSDDGGFFDWNDGYITYEPLCCGQGLRVNSNFIVNKNVGIGTSSPADALDVAGNITLSGGAKEIRFRNSSGAAEQYVWHTGTSLGLGRGSANNSMFITSTGNVGIGTQDLSGSEKLAISNGSTKLGIYPGYLFGTPDSNSVTLEIPGVKNLGIWDNLFVDNNVGIGTSGSASKLTVYDGRETTTQTEIKQALGFAGIQISTDYTANAFTPGVFWQTSNDNSTKPKAGIYLKETGSGTYMYFGTSNSYVTGITNDALVIDPDGKVGIGTTSPKGKLDVYGDIRGVNDYSFSGSQDAIDDWDSSGLLANPTAWGQSVDGWYIDSNAADWNRGIMSKRRFRRTPGLTLEYEADLTSIRGNNVHYMVGFVDGNSTSYTFQQNPSNLIYHNNSDLRVYENANDQSTAYSFDTRGEWWKFKIVLKGSGADYYVYRDGKWNTILSTGTNSNKYLRVLVSAYNERMFFRNMRVYQENQQHNFDSIVAMGNVGIGTNSPGAKLEVNYGGAGRLCLGNVGHGTNWPGLANCAQLTTTGYALIQEGSGAYTLINKNSATGFIGFRVANADKMVINELGKVGIGTTSPGAKLEIAGEGTDNTPNGNMKITNQAIMFGGPNNGYEFNSAQISAGRHVANSLNIVGMGQTYNQRRVDLWAEGGFKIYGPLCLSDGCRESWASVGSGLGSTVDNPFDHLWVRGGGGGGQIRVAPSTSFEEASIGFYRTRDFSSSNTHWVIGVGAWHSDNKDFLRISSSDAKGIPIMTFDDDGAAGGSVGIGMDNPDNKYRLHVAGSMNLAYFDKQNLALSSEARLALADDLKKDRIGLDVAELFESKEEVEVGDIMVVSRDDERKLSKSQERYQQEVVGIVSGSPAILFEGPDVIAGSAPNIFKKGMKPPIALAGRIPVKISLENGPIKPGDYLTTSSKPGVAMRATEPGATIGVALESYTHDNPENKKILVFVNIGERNLSSTIRSLQERLRILEGRLK